MIIIKLMDGLGNQMFQYAYGRFLQITYNEPMIIETTKLNSRSIRGVEIQKLNIPFGDDRTNNIKRIRFTNNKFENIILSVVSKTVRIICEKLGVSMHNEDGFRKMSKIGFYTTEETSQFFPFVPTKMPLKFVRGYFQNEKFFRSISAIIKQELKINENIISPLAKDKAKRMAEEDSVSVHIRRGDYIGNQVFEVCGQDYYVRAINYMKSELKDPVFYVFSNSKQDIDWIKRNYDLPGKIKYVDWSDSDIEDLYMMYHCRNHIISNSTFSWWGSYLCESTGGRTICPSRWNNRDKTMGIVLDNWIQIVP